MVIFIITLKFIHALFHCQTFVLGNGNGDTNRKTLWFYTGFFRGEKYLNVLNLAQITFVTAVFHIS